MLLAISSQALAGAFVDAKEIATKTEWQDALSSVSSTWETAFKEWWRSLQTENLEYLTTENRLYIEVEQDLSMTWQEEFTQNTTNWS